jgi:hypothetical protein
MIRFSCPKCKLVLQAAEQKVGSITSCPKCSKRMKVPDGPSKAPIEDSRMSMEGPKEWYYVRDKRKQGPVSLQELRQLAGDGKLSAADMVLKDGTQKWLTAGALPEVFPAGAKEPVRPGAVPPRPVLQARPTMPGSAAPAENRPSSVKLRHPVPAVSPPAPPPALPDLDDYIDEPPLPSDAEGPHTPRDESTKVSPRSKKKRKRARRGRPSGALRTLVAAWLGVVVFRTVALIQFDPQLSLWIWPLEWLAGLAIAFLSYRRRIRLGVLVGLLGPLVVLSALGAFLGMGMSKEEGLEYLRYVMLPYGVIALLLGFLVLRAARRGGHPPAQVKSIRTRKKRKQPSTMRMQSESEVAALE